MRGGKLVVARLSIIDPSKKRERCIAMCNTNDIARCDVQACKNIMSIVRAWNVQSDRAAAVLGGCIWARDGLIQMLDMQNLTCRVLNIA